MTDLYFYLRGLLKNERGQTMAEYAVVLGLITLAIVGAITVLGTQISSALNAVQAKI
jgi:Flp pilus assembly pilin Flp